MTEALPIPSLLTQVAEGQEEAMAACIQEYKGLVWSIARRILPDTGEAEDLVQEVFAELWRCADRFDPARGCEKTFIAVITRRRATDLLRRKAARPELVGVEDESNFDRVDPRAKWQDPGGPTFTSTELNALVASLPDDTANLIGAHFHRGLTHGEIATETGLALGTVKTRLRRGLVQLRQLAAEKGAIS